MHEKRDGGRRKKEIMELENGSKILTLNTGLDICLASASVVIVSGSSLHLSESSHSADANTSAMDILPLGSGFSRFTMIVSASKKIMGWQIQSFKKIYRKNNVLSVIFAGILRAKSFFVVKSI